jgi:hypothetical protein
VDAELVALRVEPVGLAAHGLILHWNGTSWTKMPTPNPSGMGNNNDLNGVAATTANDAWAAGEFDANGSGHPLILYWNGTRWSRVTTPSLPSGFPPNDLFGVAVASGSSTWAVGTYNGNAAALILHWTGTRWIRAGDPLDPARFSSRLFGFALGPGGSAWAVDDDRSVRDSIVTVPLALRCC